VAEVDPAVSVPILNPRAIPDDDPFFDDLFGIPFDIEDPVKYGVQDEVGPLGPGDSFTEYPITEERYRFIHEVLTEDRKAIGMLANSNRIYRFSAIAIYNISLAVAKVQFSVYAL